MARGATKKKVGVPSSEMAPTYSLSHCNLSNARTPMTDGEVRALVAVAEALKCNADAIKAAIETFKTPALYAPLVSMGK